MRDLLKVTLFDLIIRDILAIDEEIIAASGAAASRELLFVIPGNNFPSYMPISHESVFITSMKNDNDGRIVLQRLSKMVYWEGEDDSDYIEKIISQPRMHGFFTKSIWQYIFGGFKLSQSGKKMKAEIEKEIDVLEDLLSKYLLEYDIRSEKIVKPIAGNLAHLKNLDPQLSKIVNNPFLFQFAAYLSIDYTPKSSDGSTGRSLYNPFR